MTGHAVPPYRDLPKFAELVHAASGVSGLFCGITDGSMVLFWPDGGGGATEVDPRDLRLPDGITYQLRGV